METARRGTMMMGGKGSYLFGLGSERASVERDFRYRIVRYPRRPDQAQLGRNPGKISTWHCLS